MKQWESLFAELRLSSHEKKAIVRFCAEPQGLGFLPLSELLKHHHRRGEAMELLAWGVKHNPGYLPARVKLARELLLRGVVCAAWDVLLVFLEGSEENFLGYKTAFFCALLLGNRAESFRLAKLLEALNQYDRELKTLVNCLLLEGFSQAQQELLAALASQGVKVVRPGRQQLAGASFTAV